MKRTPGFILLLIIFVLGLVLIQTLPVQASSNFDGLSDDVTETLVTPNDTPTINQTPSPTLSPTASQTSSPTLSQTASLTPSPTASETTSLLVLGASGDTSTPTTTFTPTVTTSYHRPLISMDSITYNTNDTGVGNIFPLSAVISNQGQERAYNIIVTFSSSDVQAKYNGGVLTISTLDSGANTAITQYFMVKESCTTYQTSIEVKVEYENYNGTNYSQSFTYAISVAGLKEPTSTVSVTPTPLPTRIGQPHVVITKYYTDKTNLQPGDEFSLSMYVQNQGLYKAHNVSLTVGTGNFLPLTSSNTHVIGDMLSDGTSLVKQSLVVNPTLSAGSIPITVTFSYKDQTGTTINEDQTITLLIYQDPFLEVSFYEEIGLFKVGEMGTLPIQVINLTSNSILLGDITVSLDSATLSNKKMFIGSLDGGSSFTLDTDITPQESGEQTVEVEINYLDNFKKQQTLTYDLFISVSGTSADASTGQGSPQTGNEQENLSLRENNNFSQDGPLQVVLRFVSGFLGFDSAAGVFNSPGASLQGGGMRQFATPTITPKP